MHSNVTVMLMLLTLLNADARAQHSVLTASQKRQIDSAVTQYMTRRRVPGASVAVSLGGQLAYAQGFGMADIEHAVRVTPATHFQSASTLKTITATAMLQLAESRRSGA